jgi:hypothetical protein
MSNTRNVRTLTDYIRVIEGIAAEWNRLQTTTAPWFRGQVNAKWRLIPGLYRGWIDSYYERELVRDFRLHSSILINRLPVRYLEWLFLMQHYGMPTRLIDWTESHLSALYFAVSNRTSKVNGAVWVLDPWSINNQAIAMESVPTAELDLLSVYALSGGSDGLGRKLVAKVPVAVRPPRDNPRINAQRGAFTIHGSLKQGLDTIVRKVNRNSSDSQIRLHKVIIEGSSKELLRRQLYLAGVTEAVLFPDLVGLCAEISYRYSKEYMELTASWGDRLKPKRSQKRLFSRVPTSS